MKVYIVGNGKRAVEWRCSYVEMYQRAGYEVVYDLCKADLVQFTGGEDVSPHLYGEEKHPRTNSSIDRDIREMTAFEQAYNLGIPMVGICRGAQFLNVMNDGKMWQHVDGHAIGGTHPAVDVKSGKIVNVTSTHHQMMRPTEHAIIIATAQISNCKENLPIEDNPDHEIGLYRRDLPFWEDQDIEVVFYEGTKCLCFQPHPELGGESTEETREYFFKLLGEYLL